MDEKTPKAPSLSPPPSHPPAPKSDNNAAEEEEDISCQQQKKDKEAMEDLQRAVGSCGKFQWLMVLSIKLGLVPISWSMLFMAFGGIVPDWWCSEHSSIHNLSSPSSSSPSSLLVSSSSSSSSPSLSLWSSSSPFPPSSNGDDGMWSRDNASYQQCYVTGSTGDTCLSHVVFDTSVSTVVSQWKLLCHNKHLKPLMTSMQMVGVLVGAFLAGQSSDALGRRFTCYASLLWHAVWTLVAAFSVSWQMFLIMRIVIGMSLGAYFVASFPFCFEFVEAKHRQLVAFTPAWNLGLSTFALGAWLMPDWRHLHLGACVLTLPVLLTWFLVPESARWLATKNRLKEAEHVIGRVARMNGRKTPPEAKHVLQQVALTEQRSRQGQGGNKDQDQAECPSQGKGEGGCVSKGQGRGRRYTYLDVYRGWRMAMTTLICNFLWISLAMTYYGMAFGVSALSGNFYLNMFLMNIIEIPAKILCAFIADRLGRRMTCCLLFWLCSLSSFAILVVGKTAPESVSGSVVTVLAMVSKVSVGSVWMVTATLTTELYPTVVRSIGYGSCSSLARIGGALAPMVLNMDTASDVVRAYVIVGAVAALSGIAVLFLRETSGQGLEDSITVKVRPPKVKVKAKARPSSISSSSNNNDNDNNNNNHSPLEMRVWTVDEGKYRNTKDNDDDDNDNHGDDLGDEVKGKERKKEKEERQRCQQSTGQNGVATAERKSGQHVSDDDDDDEIGEIDIRDIGVFCVRL